MTDNLLTLDVEDPQRQPDAATTPSCTTTAATAAHCQYYHAAKKRLCNWPCKPGYNFCGNHLHYATGAGEQRMPCPANPKHDVPVSQLKAHLKRCPEAVKAAAARAQPYFCENLNTGAIDPQQALIQLNSKLIKQQQGRGSSNIFVQDNEAARVAEEACASFLRGTAEQRQAAAVAAGPHWFAELVAKVEAAHAALSDVYPLQRRLLGGCDGDPDELFKFSRDLDPLMPFDAKHAAQHASIVGNMEAAGLLAHAAGTVYVELGAGKGYLTAWLHQVCGAQDLVLLDIQSNFTKKADRRLRHTRLTRVAVNLKDAALQQLLQLHVAGCVPKVQLEAPLPKPGSRAKSGSSRDTKASKRGRDTSAAAAAAVAAEGGDAVAPDGGGGAAAAAAKTLDSVQQGTRPHACNLKDSLTACPSRHSAAEQQASEGDAHMAAAVTAAVQQPRKQHIQQQQQGQHVVPWVVHGKHLCGAATDFALRACYNTVTQRTGSSSSSADAPEQLLQAAAAAAAEDAAANVGGSSSSCITPAEQPWQVAAAAMDAAANGGAHCRHTAEVPLQAAGNGGALCGNGRSCCVSSSSSNGMQQQQQFSLRGVAVAACCHHRCGWTAYCGKEHLLAHGIGRQEFETMAWLTSWALCGHEAPPGAGEEEGHAQQQQNNTLNNTPDNMQQGTSSSSNEARALAERHGTCASSATVICATANGASSSSSSTVSLAAIAAAAADRVTAAAAAAGIPTLDYHPADLLDRDQKIALGLKCKQLIDIGRCGWILDSMIPAMQQQTASGKLCVTRVAYIDQSVTGENTLLLVGSSTHA